MSTDPRINELTAKLVELKKQAGDLYIQGKLGKEDAVESLEALHGKLLAEIQTVSAERDKLIAKQKTVEQDIPYASISEMVESLREIEKLRFHHDEHIRMKADQEAFNHRRAIREHPDFPEWSTAEENQILANKIKGLKVYYEKYGPVTVAEIRAEEARRIPVAPTIQPSSSAKEEKPSKTTLEEKRSLVARLLGPRNKSIDAYGNESKPEEKKIEVGKPGRKSVLQDEYE